MTQRPLPSRYLIPALLLGPLAILAGAEPSAGEAPPAAVAAAPAPSPDSLPRASQAVPEPPRDSLPVVSRPVPALPRERSQVMSAKVLVQGRKGSAATNNQMIRDRDLALRVKMEPSDILKVTPGLVTSTHAGGGKANQYFIRGFDADHGTDLALWMDGMPINSVSHGHGQGYADLNFIIPELVDRVEVEKGPYSIQYGDFATAGAVKMSSRNHTPENMISLRGGMYGTYRGLAIATLNTPTRPLVAAEVYRYDGPYDSPEDLNRFNVFLKTPLFSGSGSQLNLTLMGYGNGWNASGQIPLREVEAGRLSKWGTEDPTDGGHSQRYSVSTDYVSIPGPNEEFKASAYFINYSLALFSNFTFFSRDSVQGDQINQRDARSVMGTNASYRKRMRAGTWNFSSLVGMGSRFDKIRTSLDYSTARTLTGNKVSAGINEGSLSAYVMESVAPNEFMYLEAGTRADYVGFNVEDERSPTGDSSLTGFKSATIFSPKVNLVLTPMKSTEIFLNYGEGFHSNDARGVVSRQGAARPLTKARGYETAVQTKLWDRLDLGASLWWMDLDGELVWVGDDGGTEERGATNRRGLDLEMRYQVLPWLWTDLDYTASRARYVEDNGGGTAVALAPTQTLSGGVSVAHAMGFHGSLRAQLISDRPATEDESLTAEGYMVVDLGLGYRFRQVEASLNIANLLDTEWRQTQFANESRLPGEGAPVQDLHIVPGTPFKVQAGLTMYY